MRLKNIVIAAAAVFLAAIAVFDWLLCIALSRNERRMEQKQNTHRSRENINPRRKNRKRLEHWQVIALFMVAYDIVAVNGAYGLSLWIRFDCMYSRIPGNYLSAWMKFIPAYTLICLVIFECFHLYNSIWRFASYSELLRITAACGITSLIHITGITAIFCRMPVSYYLIGTAIQFLMILGVRFSYRLILMEKSRREKSGDGMRRRVMLIGAGAAGQMILRELNLARETSAKVCCIIDDNPNKWGRSIEGIPIVGGREDILVNAEKYRVDQIFLAIPSSDAETRRDILNICKETGCDMKILPGMYQLVNGEVSVGQMKEVAVEDLLGRDPIKVNLEEIFDHISGRTILVTGGGGSIGSELCRQIAAHAPRQLIIFDVYENNAYDIEQELRSGYPDLCLTVLIGSVRDSRRINSVFEKYQPEIVYHAAAHKHVPLMEDSPCEAIKNNVMGTYKTALAALRNGCRRFVLISTDKAVNPTNMMGASKRLCEMVIQSMDRISAEHREDILPNLNGHFYEDDENGKSHLESAGRLGNVGTDSNEAAQSRDGKAEFGKAGKSRSTRTEFVAVRFGNVLGSNGSVIPLFKKQIARGGPVTVTHPDIIRYFMTIPEAVSLVLQAGTYARGGEIFVLDMGAPVKIDTLARNLIKLSGYKPDVDIPIVYTGLRPGEKLYEEKLMAEEGLKKTRNDLIHVGKPIPFDVEEFLGQLEELAEASYGNSEKIVELVKKIVPTYRPEAMEMVKWDEVYGELMRQVAVAAEN